MIFTITSINKGIDLYEVCSDMGEVKMVTSTQITAVLANGFEFTNAYLTRKGFAIKTPSGTRYVQLSNMPKDLERAILARLKYIKDMEEAKKQQMTSAIKKGYTKPNLNGIKTKGTSYGRNSRESVVYKGQVYLSAEQLCKKFNRDVDTFKSLYNKGYSMDECLGLVALRPESEITPRNKMEKFLDRLQDNRDQ